MKPDANEYGLIGRNTSVHQPQGVSSRLFPFSLWSPCLRGSIPGISDGFQISNPPSGHGVRVRWYHTVLSVYRQKQVCYV